METKLSFVLVFIACLGLSFVLSGMEAGVFALSRLRFRQQMRAGKASARLLYGYLERPENFLWTILVGNTVANFFILGFTIVWLHQRLAGHHVLFAVLFLVLVFLFYALFDLLPKMLFQLYPNRLCLLLARPFRLVHFALRPLVALVEWCSGLMLAWRGGRVFTGHLFGNREELRLVMQESAQGFTSEERAMINRVLDLQNLTVRQITVPMNQVVAITAQTPVDEILKLCGERKLTRFPVWVDKERQQRVIGIVSLNTLLYHPDATAKRPAVDFLKPALYLNEDLRLEVALQRLQRSGLRLAVVLGRDGREIGVASLGSILKVIFGEVKL